MKKKEKITFEKARNFSVIEMLNRSGHFAKKMSEKEAWFLSPFRKETDPSFKVSLVLNRWYDFGIGEGGNVIDLVMKLNALNPIEALQNLDNSSFSVHSPPDYNETDDEVKVLKVVDIQHYALKQYLEYRCIYLYKNEINVKEIHYQLKGRKYFAVGFRNNSQGFELRSKYTKICIGKKDATLIKNGSERLCVFEGFMDYLSYQNIPSFSANSNCDFLILNSVAMVERCNEILAEYSLVELYLDNDIPGKEFSKKIIEKYKQVTDKSYIYSNYKDLNDWLMSQNNNKRINLLK